MVARIPLPPELREGAFSVRIGRTTGLGDKRMRGADLQKPFHGVRTAHPIFSILDLCLAYQARMSPRAFFCEVTAAQLLGVPLPIRLENSRTLKVAVPPPNRAPEGKGVIGSVMDVPAVEVSRWRGLRISSPTRTWCDLGAALTLPDLVAAGDYLVHWKRGLTTTAELDLAVAAHSGRRGVRKLRAALPLLNDRAESRRESLLRLALRPVSGIVANLDIRTSGRFNYRADLAIPEHKVIIEYQSDYHADIAQFRRDMIRRTRLEADGWSVILVNADDLRNQPELLLRIRSAITRQRNFLRT